MNVVLRVNKIITDVCRKPATENLATTSPGTTVVERSHMLIGWWIDPVY